MARASSVSGKGRTLRRDCGAPPLLRHFGLPLCVVIVLSLMLSGCSRTTFVYNRLDFFLPWYLQDYAPLDSDQEDYLDELLPPFLGWHRRSELPCYVQLLEQLQTVLQRPVDAADVAAVTAALERAWYRMESAALDWLLPLAARLSDEQVVELLDELQERQEELAADYLPRSGREFQDDSYELMVETAEDYLGRLQTEQRDLLRSGSRRLRRVDEPWLQQRQELLRQVARQLQRQPGWQERLRALIVARHDRPSPTYREAFEHNIGLMQQLAAAVLNRRSERQSRHLQKRLGRLRDDLHSLAAQGTPGDGAPLCRRGQLPALVQQ